METGFASDCSVAVNAAACRANDDDRGPSGPSEMVRPRKLGLDLVLSVNRSVSPPTSLSLRSRSWLSAGPIGRRESIAWTKAEMSSSSVFVLRYDAFYDKVCE